MTALALRTRPSPWAADFRAALKLGWPLILTNLAQTIITATDVMFMGRLGPDALAAGALSASLYQAFMTFCMGLVSATIPMMAHALGRERYAVSEVRQTVRQGLWSALLICLPTWVALWYTDSMLLALGQQPALVAHALEFMRTLQWALLPFLGYLVLRSFFATMEKPLWTLMIALFAIAFNALAAWALMFGHLGMPAMGLAGAGIASTVSSWMMFIGLALVALWHPRFRRYHLFGRFWQADWPHFRKVWRIGFPIGITFAFETSIFYAAVMMMGLLGPASLAANAIAMQISMLSFMVPLALGQVATIRVGRALGARDIEGVKRAGWSAYVLGVGFMGGMAIVMLSVPTLLIGVFLDPAAPQNAEVVGLAISFLACAALFQIGDGAQAVCAGMLRGLHDTRVPMLIAAFGYWGVGLPLGWVLAFHAGLGGVGVWLGLAAGLSTVASLMTWRWLRRERLALH